MRPPHKRPIVWFLAAALVLSGCQTPIAAEPTPSAPRFSPTETRFPTTTVKQTLQPSNIPTPRQTATKVPPTPTEYVNIGFTLEEVQVHYKEAGFTYEPYAAFGGLPTVVGFPLLGSANLRITGEPDAVSEIGFSMLWSSQNPEAIALSMAYLLDLMEFLAPGWDGMSFMEDCLTPITGNGKLTDETQCDTRFNDLNIRLLASEPDEKLVMTFTKNRQFAPTPVVTPTNELEMATATP